MFLLTIAPGAKELSICS